MVRSAPLRTDVRWVGDFFDSVGVNASYSRTVFDSMTVDQVAGYMQDVCARHVRSLIEPTRDANNNIVAVTPTRFTRGLYNSYGIKTMPLFKPRDPYQKKPTGMSIDTYINTIVKPTIDDHLDWVRTVPEMIGTGIDTLENFNEIDRLLNNQDPAVFGPESGNGVPYLWTQSAAMRSAHPNLKIHPMSLIGFNMHQDAPYLEKDVYGNDIANSITLGVVHHYPENKKPEPDPALSDATWETARFYPATAPTLNSTTLLLKLQHSAWYVTKGRWPIDMTEFNCDGITTEATRAIYMPRMLLEAFRIGIRRTYMYLLLNDNSGRRDLALYDGSPSLGYTPTATALELKKLATILADSAADYSPTPLGYTLGGVTSSLRKILFQKSNGQYWLALWLAVDIVNADGSATTAATARQNVTVTFTTSRTVQYYRDLSTTPTTTASTGTTFTFSVGATISFVKIT